MGLAPWYGALRHLREVAADPDRPILRPVAAVLNVSWADFGTSVLALDNPYTCTEA
jgi:hypothetical protein